MDDPMAWLTAIGLGHCGYSIASGQHAPHRCRWVYAFIEKILKGLQKRLVYL